MPILRDGREGLANVLKLGIVVTFIVLVLVALWTLWRIYG